MNKTPKSKEDLANLGCLILVGLFVLPMLLASLFKAIFPFILLGGLGFSLYNLYLYNERTGNITYHLEQLFKITSSKKSIDLNQLDYQIRTLRIENETLKKESKKQIQKAIKEHSKSIGKKKKKEILDNLFPKKLPISYSGSEKFEREKEERNRKRKKDELDKREFQLEINGKVFDQDRKILDVDKRVTDVANEAKQDRFKIREEMREGWKNIDAKFEKVDAKFSYMDARFYKFESDFSSFKSYVAEKFGRIETDFAKEIYSVKDLIGKLRVYTKEEFSKVKLQFGSEVLRMDKQMLKVVKHLDKYETKVQKFANEVMTVKTAAMAHSIRAEDMLNKVNTSQLRHKLLMGKYSDKMELTLKKIAVHDEGFANVVGAAKLRLDEITQDIHFNLKNVALERVGIEALRSDYNQRVTLEKEKISNLNEKKRHLEDRINMAIDKKGKQEEISSLRHQLHLTKENLSFSKHRGNLLQQENGMIRRFTRK